MNPVIIIPTFVSARRRKEGGDVLTTYDHATQLTRAGELPRLFDSLCKVRGARSVIVLVVAEPAIEMQAAEKIQAIAAQYENLDVLVIGGAEERIVKARLAEMGFDTAMVEGRIGLSGYGAIRNLGLVIADVYGFDAAVFLDDDEVIDDPDFLKKAVYGLGKLTRKGIPIIAKTGFYLNEQGSYKSKEKEAWYNRFWNQGPAFNEWIEAAMHGPRLSRSNHVCGGCLALHSQAFKRLSFDPWIPRGEDLDYMLNLRMYGSDIWFDNKWSMHHLPPESESEGIRFRQDVFRWLYEFRKLEYSRTQIDLLQVRPQSLEPYPGPFLESGIRRRIRLTALLRRMALDDKEGYKKAAHAARKRDGEACQYAEDHCMDYFTLQRLWPKLMICLDCDPELQEALFQSAEERIDRVANGSSRVGAVAVEAAREAKAARAAKPAVKPAAQGAPADAAAAGAARAAQAIPTMMHTAKPAPAPSETLDPGMTCEIRLNLADED